MLYVTVENKEEILLLWIHHLSKGRMYWAVVTEIKAMIPRHSPAVIPTYWQKQLKSGMQCCIVKAFILI